MSNPASKSTTLTHSTPEQFYKFFHDDAMKLRNICSDIVKDIRFIDPATSKKEIVYAFPGVQKEEKLKYEVISTDEASKTIKYIVLEGSDILNHYSIGEVTLEVKDDNTAIWTVNYTRKDSAASPHGYLELLDKINVAVDKHFEA